MDRVWAENLKEIEKKLQEKGFSAQDRALFEARREMLKKELEEQKGFCPTVGIEQFPHRRIRRRGRERPQPE